MRRLLIGGALGVVVISLAACGGSSEQSSSEADMRQRADLYSIGQIQSTFHEALSKKDIDLMMSLWAPNATITVGPGQTLSGTKKIREHWLTSKPFQPTSTLVSETPSYKMRATANGDRGTLFFECHLVDSKTAKAVVVSGADTEVAKIDGRWVITSFVGATGSLSP
jgi:ketosteroid isomerase-like protein